MTGSPRRLDQIVALAQPRAESPMETRLRLLLHDHGPPPAVQFPLRNGHGRVLARFDLAYPEARLAISYDGDEYHRGRRGPDNHRDIAASLLGWETMRFQSGDIYLTPRRTPDAVARMVAVRSPRAALLPSGARRAAPTRTSSTEPSSLR
jgi:hypothetical protein